MLSLLEVVTLAKKQTGKKSLVGADGPDCIKIVLILCKASQSRVKESYKGLLLKIHRLVWSQ